MAIPCGAWNLDDNMIIQRVAFVLTIFCWGVWIAATLNSLGGEGLPMPEMVPGGVLPAVNTNPTTGSIAGVLGTVLFNFGFVTTVPSWINEKAPRVSVSRTLWWSTTICVLVFMAVGVLVCVSRRTDRECSLPF